MCRDYYVLKFMDPAIDTSPIAPALANFFDNVLDRSVQELNFKARCRRCWSCCHLRLVPSFNQPNRSISLQGFATE